MSKFLHEVSSSIHEAHFLSEYLWNRSSLIGLWDIFLIWNKNWVVLLFLNFLPSIQSNKSQIWFLQVPDTFIQLTDYKLSRLTHKCCFCTVSGVLRQRFVFTRCHVENCGTPCNILAVLHSRVWFKHVFFLNRTAWLPGKYGLNGRWCKKCCIRTVLHVRAVRFWQRREINFW